MNGHEQSTSYILMVRPEAFGYNPQTAESNAFQSNDGALTNEEIRNKAREEFDTFATDLSNKGVNVMVIKDTHEPETPDAVFPNNWITTHEDGTIITYPMEAPLRRLERRDDVIYTCAEKFVVKKRHYLEFYEDDQKYLEGTGSMIFDRANKIVYSCRSTRTHPMVLNEFCQITGYRPVVFSAVDGNNHPIYHTNVMMAMGDEFVVICMESIKTEEERSRLYEIFSSTGKDVIEITFEQVNSFAGNMLQVLNSRNQRIMVMSEQAYNSLRADQIERIRQYAQILYSPLYTIENYGGGSARCMIAEIFLPEK